MGTGFIFKGFTVYIRDVTDVILSKPKSETECLHLTCRNRKQRQMNDVSRVDLIKQNIITNISQSL